MSRDHHSTQDYERKEVPKPGLRLRGWMILQAIRWFNDLRGSSFPSTLRISSLDSDWTSGSYGKILVTPIRGSDGAVAGLLRCELDMRSCKLRLTATID